MGTALQISANSCKRGEIDASVAANVVGTRWCPSTRENLLSDKTRSSMMRLLRYGRQSTRKVNSSVNEQQPTVRRALALLATSSLVLTVGLSAGLAPSLLPVAVAVAADSEPTPAAAATTAAADDAPPLVTIPGSHGAALGCDNDWLADCAQSALTLRSDGVYEGTFELPAGTYEYKVAVGGTWDVNYGANGVPGGDNATYTHAGGPISFFYDPRTNVFSNTAEGPVITLPGSLQQALGCDADWQLDCLATLAQDGDGDGVYEFSTDQLPANSYEVKVAHNRSWDENYGQDGARDGANYTFAVADGKHVSFRYELDSHELEIEVADPPTAGVGELRAQWINANTIAWPKVLLAGADPQDLEWTLYAAETPGITLTGSVVTGHDQEVSLAYNPAGLSTAEKADFPHLAGAVALEVQGQDRAAIQQLLRSQLQILQLDGTSASAFTGVQLPGVIDDLYGSALADAELGVQWSDGGAERFVLWAPTARAAALVVWEGAGSSSRISAIFDENAGTWTAESDIEQGAQYVWEVEVYAHSTGAVETNTVTDPYSLALTTNSERSVAIDIGSTQWMPQLWVQAAQPEIAKSVDRAIYELHIRDFSIGDDSIPSEERGTYRAFTREGSGAAQLRELADAGITTVHLLPSFDIATINEDRASQQTPNCDLESFASDSSEQQACVDAVRGADGFNWGYDPYHFTTPEGSYAVDPEGGARTFEFREMVGSLHDMGLEVVLDQVFNHTAESGQSGKSVLDKIVPGYYHRLSDAGKVETSTCCQNVATEHAAAEKLMVDSVVTWARDYKVDGFRFDLMGHHSRDNMLAVRSALDALTVAKDGVDGSSVYLYGEGWDFGEVSGDSRFVQARQGNLRGTGISTFNDRLRDSVHGGSPVDSGSTFKQGYGTGLGTDPNGDTINGSTEQALTDLGKATDLVKVGLAGNLADYTFLASDNQERAGSDINYNGMPAGYAEQPDEVVNYVDAHDNETLYDLAVFKLPRDTSMSDRVRMNTLMLSTATLSQGVSFWHAGTELLRSKSLDRNSYDSGDWFNRIDWTGQESTFGSGLPMSGDNKDKWPIMAPLLADESLKPSAADIAAAESAALDLLRVRSDVDLLRLGDAELINQKLSFPNGGQDATPGVIVMLIDDLVGADVDPDLSGALVVFNASPDETTQVVPEIADRTFALTAAQQQGSDTVVKETQWDAATGSVTVPARTVAVLVEAQQDDGGGNGSDDGDDDNAGGPDGNDDTGDTDGEQPATDDPDSSDDAAGDDTSDNSGSDNTDSDDSGTDNADSDDAASDEDAAAIDPPGSDAGQLSDTGVSAMTWLIAVFAVFLLAGGIALVIARTRHKNE